MQVEEKIKCPKCGEECNWVSEEKGALWCYHYYGVEKTEDGKTKKKVKKHYIGVPEYSRGRPGEQRLHRIEDRIRELELQLERTKNENERKKLEQELDRLKKEKERLIERMKSVNIHLRPISDKERFVKYIKESLELMKFQDDFNEDKILQVLDLVANFLKESKGVLSEKTLEKLREIENELTVVKNN